MSNGSIDTIDSIALHRNYRYYRFSIDSYTIGQTIDRLSINNRQHAVFQIKPIECKTIDSVATLLETENENINMYVV